jgi:hypothetical protein
MVPAVGLEQPYDILSASPNAALDSYYLLSEMTVGCKPGRRSCTLPGKRQ